MRNIQLGQIEIKIGGYHSLKIFDKEQTVVDAFRYLSQEVAKALQTYLRPSEDYKPNLNKLATYAKQLRVDMQPYILSFTTDQTRGAIH